jgi:hypothetical protein
VHGEGLLGAAVANNARWCEAVCLSHGYPGVFSSRLWTSPDHDLEFYPHVITLSPDVAAPEAVMARDRSRPYAVKDSFARLDLAPKGLELLFEGEWIARGLAPAGHDDSGLCWNVVTGARELGQWETAWTESGSTSGRMFRPDLLADPRCTFLAGRREETPIAGVIAYTARGVTGISNLFGTGLPAGHLWASARPAVAALRPDLPVVGYEHGADLASAQEAGCQTLGPLRVWVHDGIVSDTVVAWR